MGVGGAVEPKEPAPGAPVPHTSPGVAKPLRPQTGSGCPWPRSGRLGSGAGPGAPHCVPPLPQTVLGGCSRPPPEPSMMTRSGSVSTLAGGSTPFPDSSRDNQAPGHRTRSSHLTLGALAGGGGTGLGAWSPARQHLASPSHRCPGEPSNWHVLSATCSSPAGGTYENSGCSELWPTIVGRGHF